MPRHKIIEEQEDEFLDYDIYEKVVDVAVVQDEGREDALVTVTVVNWDLGDSAIVRSESGEYKIVSKEFLAHSYSAQSIQFRHFLNGIEPYDWYDEINAVALTPDQMREILYAQGYVVKQELRLAELTKNTLFRGKIPVIKEK